MNDVPGLVARLLDVGSQHLGREVRLRVGPDAGIVDVREPLAPGAPLVVPVTTADRLFGSLVCDGGRACFGDDDVRFVRHLAALVGDLLASVEGLDDRMRVPRVLAALRGGMRMVVQPIADLGSGRIAGLEALARIDGDGRSPDVVFGEARAIGLGTRLELAALRLALALMPRVPNGWYLSLNVSPELIVLPELADLLRRHKPGRVVLELTEHARVEDYGGLLEALVRLRADGHRIAVDDVGAGFASLRHVLTIRPDVLKLDMALTRSIDTDAVRRALARSIIAFAEEIDAVVVAEGVETEDERSVLLDLGVRIGQGYLLGRPAPLDDELRRGTLAAR